MLFKKVQEEDIEAMRQIYLYYIEHTTATYHKRAITWEEMKSILVVDHPKYESYGIWEEECLCGYVILTQFKAREAFDHTAEVTLYLKHGYEGRGIGGEALTFIEERAIAKEIHTLLAVICGENTASIKLFERHHYVKCAHYKEVGYKFGRWLDLVSYQKLVDEKKNK